MALTLVVIASVAAGTPSRAQAVSAAGAGASAAAYALALEARGASPARLAAGVTGGLPAERVRDAGLVGADDVAAGYVMGDGAPVTAIIADVRGGYPWSAAAWLATLERFLAEPPLARGAGTVYFFLVDGEARARPPSPGGPLIREPRLRAALADMGVDAVVVLDFLAEPYSMTLGAASWRRQSPRRVVAAARRAARFVPEPPAGPVPAGGTGPVARGMPPLAERPVADFYAAAGLSSGSASLAAWLEAGLPAISLASGAAADTAAGAADIAAFLAAFVSGLGEAGSDEDVNYLRYPTPGGPFLVADSVIVYSSLAALAAIVAAASLGLLKGRLRTVSLSAIAKEIASASILSFLALAGAKGLSLVATALAARLLGTESFNLESIGPWPAALALLARAGCSLSTYYAASGLASRLGLHGDHRRIDAARASLVLLALDATLALALFPPAAPLLVVAVVVSALFSDRAVTAAAGLAFVGFAALPFVDPRAIAAISDASGGSGSVATSMLGAGLLGSALAASLAAPIGLWLGAASSPEAKLRRGRRTAAFWLAGAVLFSGAEAFIVIVIARGYL